MSETANMTLTQWDTGRFISFSDIPDETFLHLYFQMQGDDGTLHRLEETDPFRRDTETNTIYFSIPDELLQYAGELIVSVYATTTGSSSTCSTLVFPVVARDKPAGYVYTPAETKMYYSLSQRIQALENAVFQEETT